MISPNLTCAECSLCCELVGVPEINKPRGEICKHVVSGKPGGGCCSLHPAAGGRGQPESCEAFYCSWLASQKIDEATAQACLRQKGFDPRMPPSMRPDRSHVVFGPCDDQVENKLYINVDPKHPDAWRDPECLTWLNRLLFNGAEVVLFVGDESANLKLGRRPA